MKKVSTLIKWGVGVCVFAANLLVLPSTGSAATRIPISYLSYLSYLSYYSFIRYPAAISYLAPARDLNGISLNGEFLDDRYIKGISLEGVIINGKKQVTLSLKGTEFKHLNQLDGAIMTAVLDDDTPLALRIDSVEKRNERVDPDTVHYFVSYETDHGWEPLCGLDEYDDPIGAIPLLGRWDYSQGTSTGGAKIEDDAVFTFACDGYVLHKCVDAGYKPWEEVVVCHEPNDCETISLAAQHQACTRMLRADYCGDGTSYTENGVLVAMYDSVGLRYDSEDWSFEAEWDEDGAVCVQQDRIDGLVPTCMDYLLDDTCGDTDHFQDGVLIFSELP